MREKEERRFVLTARFLVSYFDMGDVHADLALAFLSYLYCDLYKNALASDLILIAQNYQTKRLEVKRRRRTKSFGEKV